jgi:hypothetical protein
MGGCPVLEGGDKTGCFRGCNKQSSVLDGLDGKSHHEIAFKKNSSDTMPNPYPPEGAFLPLMNRAYCVMANLPI